MDDEPMTMSARMGSLREEKRDPCQALPRCSATFHPAAVELRGSMAAAAGIKVSARFNLVLNAGKATPQPPVGSALGQRGLNLMNFCKAFNDETAKIKDTVPIRVRAGHRPHRTPQSFAYPPMQTSAGEGHRLRRPHLHV